MDAQTLNRNALLAMIGNEAVDRISAGGLLVELQIGEPIHHIGEPVHYLWFPLSGMVSHTVPLADGSIVEAGLVGREGVVGLLSMLGNANRATSEAMVQLPGSAYRVDLASWQNALSGNDAIMRAMLTFSHDLFMMVSQTAACNVRHDIGRRLARWLLLAHDRSDRGPMPLTQEFLGAMLGVQRNTVTVAARELQQQGAIQYSRGSILVTDRAKLESLACECYSAIQARLAGPRLG
jgi:CRP-like cAMP-binding protein